MVPFWEFIKSFCLNATRPSRVSRTGLTFKTPVFSLVNNTPGNFCSIVKKLKYFQTHRKWACRRQDPGLSVSFYMKTQSFENTIFWERIISLLMRVGTEISGGSVPVCYVLQSVFGRPYFGIRKHRMNRASHSHWGCKATWKRITSGFRVATRVPRYLSYDSRISITDPSKIWISR